ncbi:hypothetical protein ACF09H_16155 [Streptomyces sp. NPDC014983]|uniref:hypothetical protein n=1 Tax=Streptomyces sp. NPDC014983 TaxID=3364933 RepID=UPI0037016220
MAWSAYRRTVAQVVGPPPEPVLFAGVSIGYADPSAPCARTGRAQGAETVTFLGGE